jgi:hypothetical protein
MPLSFCSTYLETIMKNQLAKAVSAIALLTLSAKAMAATTAACCVAGALCCLGGMPCCL